MHVGVVSGFLTKAKNMYRMLVVARCFPPIDVISVYTLQPSYKSFFSTSPEVSLRGFLKKKKFKSNETKQWNSLRSKG